MKILLTSVGRRSYLVQYFKEVIGSEGEVHVSNSTELSPAFIYADKHIKTPLIYEENYIEFLLDYCSENKIDALISLFDIDLPILSKNIEKFNDIGTKLIVSDYEVIKICNDKWLTYKFLVNNGFNAPKTYVNKDEAFTAISNNEIQYPLVIKPRWGMGSIGVSIAHNSEDLAFYYKKTLQSIQESYLKFESRENFNESVLIQEKLKGQEYGLDVINDLNTKYQNTIPKIKYAMRSGETDCAETVESDLLKSIGENLSKKLKHVGNLDVDVFIHGQEAYVLEMNARFGGGYPFSHMAGVNLPMAIVQWLNNENINPEILKEHVGVKSHKDISLIRLDKSKEV